MDRSTDYSQLRLDEAMLLLREAGYADLVVGPTNGVPTLQRIIDGLCELSQRDGLTGLANSRHFRIALERELDRVARTGEGAALLVIDVDRFKHVNDTYGHLAGDEVLRKIAETLSKAVRPMDLVARTGGDEFAVILPNSAAALARSTAERLRARAAGTVVEVNGGTSLGITLSIGGATVAPWERMTPECLIELADERLYAAKANGRDCVSLELAVTQAVSAEERAMLLGDRRRRKDE